MNAARKGKIARLPESVRAELNRRLRDGECGVRLVDWLNGRAEVRRVLAESFGGRPVNPQNLCEWRQGGYRDWLQAQAAEATLAGLVAQVGRTEPGPDTGVGTLTDRLARWLVGQYAAVTRGPSAAEQGTGGPGCGNCAGTW